MILNYRLWIIVLVNSFFGTILYSQTIIALEDCGVSYIDPQDDGPTTSGRDTLVYTHLFAEHNQLHAFYVDINAFGGQQIDRTKVFAIMPEDTLKLLGTLSFGNCPTCEDGFAFVFNDSLYAQSVSDRGIMDLWIQSFNQPPFALQGSLQTLVGTGRLSGLAPFCAKGIRVEYEVNSNPANATTEFSTHILCPEIIQDCTVNLDLMVDCPRDSFSLRAIVPSKCFSESAVLEWTFPSGLKSNQEELVLSLSENEGWFFLKLEDECCTIFDSIFVDRPQFAVGGEDLVICPESTLNLSGTGGLFQYWELPNQDTLSGGVLTLDNAQNGAYVFFAIDAAGCVDTDTVDVSILAPETPMVALPSICIGQDVQLMLSNEVQFINISWFTPEQQQLPNGIIPEIQSDDFGTYEVIGTNAAGCQTQLFFDLEANLPPELEWQIERSCDSTIIHLIPSENQYVWESGDTTAHYSVTRGGVYFLTITDENNCQSETNVEIPDPEGPAFDLEIEQPACFGDFGELQIKPEDVNRPTIYSIDGGATYTFETTYRQLEPGAYAVVAQDELGCIIEQSITIVAPDSIGVDLNQTYLEVRPNEMVDLSATTFGPIEKIQWVPKSIDSGLPTTSFLSFRNLDVRVVVEDVNGCRASDGFQLTVILSPIYRPSAFSPNNDGVNDRFTFFSDQLSGEIIENLQVFDRYGNVIFQATEIPLNDLSVGWDGTYLGKPMNAGIYTYFGRVRFGNDIKKLFEGDVMLLR